MPSITYFNEGAITSATSTASMLGVDLTDLETLSKLGEALGISGDDVLPETEMRKQSDGPIAFWYGDLSHSGASFEVTLLYASNISLPSQAVHINGIPLTDLLSVTGNTFKPVNKKFSMYLSDWINQYKEGTTQPGFEP
jgi:hypothetical protein